MTVYFPVQYTAQDPSHGLELWCHAMMGLQFAMSLLCLQRQVAKVASGLFYCSSLIA